VRERLGLVHGQRLQGGGGGRLGEVTRLDDGFFEIAAEVFAEGRLGWVKAEMLKLAGTTKMPVL
jgi:hypothetical protein